VQREVVCEPCNHDKGHLTLTDWARTLRREGDSRAAIVLAFGRGGAANARSRIG
jgi:hypothetical protein